MKQIKATIVSNNRVCEGFFELTFTWDASCSLPLPGQFCTIKTAESTVPLLRRPFAFSRVDKQKMCVSVIIQKRGDGTTYLAGKLPGDSLDVIGPLGRPFSLCPTNVNPVIVAGGIGLGPMLFLADCLKNNEKMLFVYGCRNSTMVPDISFFRGFEPVVCTDDGSLGLKGTTIDFLTGASGPDFSNSMIFCCGPHPMLEACSRIAMEKSIQCEVSIEQIMACGVGACMGCVVKTSNDSYVRVCSEGPVFNSTELSWT